MSLIGCLQGISTIVIVRYIEITILEKTAWFQVSSSQAMQDTETATDRYSTKKTTWLNNLFWVAVLSEMWLKPKKK